MVRFLSKWHHIHSEIWVDLTININISQLQCFQVKTSLKLTVDVPSTLMCHRRLTSSSPIKVRRQNVHVLENASWRCGPTSFGYVGMKREPHLCLSMCILDGENNWLYIITVWGIGFYLPLIFILQMKWRRKYVSSFFIITDHTD